MRERTNLQKIELVMENLEVLEFSPEDFQMLRLENVHRDIVHNTDATYEYDQCAKALIKMKSASKRTKKGKAIHRAGQFRDLVSVDLIYDDGNMRRVFLPWEDEDREGTSNKLQYNVYASDGILTIMADESFK